MATRKNSTAEVKIESVKSEPRKFNPDDIIVCRSVTYGELLGDGRKTKMLYSWAGYGDEVGVEYQDLMSWKSTKSQYLYAPHFVIEDEELLALEQWKDVKEIHDKIKQLDCDNLFDLPVDKFERAMENVPKTYHVTIRNMANAKILNGELDSLAKIKVIDKNFGTDLMSLLK